MHHLSLWDSPLLVCAFSGKSDSAFAKRGSNRAQLSTRRAPNSALAAPWVQQLKVITSVLQGHNKMGEFMTRPYAKGVFYLVAVVFLLSLVLILTLVLATPCKADHNGDKYDAPLSECLTEGQFAAIIYYVVMFVLSMIWLCVAGLMWRPDDASMRSFLIIVVIVYMLQAAVIFGIGLIIFFYSAWAAGPVAFLTAVVVELGGFAALGCVYRVQSLSCFA